MVMLCYCQSGILSRVAALAPRASVDQRSEAWERYQKAKAVSRSDEETRWVIPMQEPKRIGSVVKGVFVDIQHRYENPQPVDSTELTSRPRLTGRDMLEYLHNEIRRRGIGRKKGE